MLNRLRSYFTPTIIPETIELNEPMPFSSIRQMKNGKFRLLTNYNEVVGTYSRRRDAVRGAARRGLTVA